MKLLYFTIVYDQKNNLDEIEKHIKSNKLSKFPFSKSGNITSNLNDNEYLDLVKKGIKHCEKRRCISNRSIKKIQTKI